MNAHSGKFVAALALLALASCAVIPVHDAVLEDSRTYVYAVRSDPTVVAYASVEIDQAVATLRRADDVAARGGSLSEVHDLAALARDRATLAQQTARMKAADVAAQAERQRLEVAARTRDAEAAQRAARCRTAAACFDTPLPPGARIEIRPGTSPALWRRGPWSIFRRSRNPKRWAR